MAHPGDIEARAPERGPDEPLWLTEPDYGYYVGEYGGTLPERAFEVAATGAKRLVRWLCRGESPFEPWRCPCDGCHRHRDCDGSHWHEGHRRDEPEGPRPAHLDKGHGHGGHGPHRPGRHHRHPHGHRGCPCELEREREQLRNAYRRAVCAATEVIAEYGEGQVGGLALGDFRMTHYEADETSGRYLAIQAAMQELVGTNFAFQGVGRR